LVDQYARKYRMIAVLPADTEAYQKGKGITEEKKPEIVRIGRDVFSEANIDAPDKRAGSESCRLSLAGVLMRPRRRPCFGTAC